MLTFPLTGLDFLTNLGSDQDLIESEMGCLCEW